MELDWQRIVSAGGVALLVVVLIRLVERLVGRDDVFQRVEIERLKLLNAGSETLTNQLIAMNQHLIMREEKREELIALLMNQLRSSLPAGAAARPASDDSKPP
jgi:hypothetical protein